MPRNGDRREKLDKAARAGWLYYVAGNSQEEIARKLHVSRQTAQRLVSTSVEEKLIKFHLDHPLSSCLELSEKLADRFGLRFCEVVPSDPDAPGLLTGVASAAATEMERRFKSSQPIVIGLGTGRVLRACVEQMPSMDCAQHHAVSLVGNMHPNGTATAFNIVVRMADRIGSLHSPMPLPVIVRNESELSILQAQEPVKRTLELCEKADVTFLGIGHIDDSAPLVVDGFISAHQSRAMTKMGAVGEIVGWVFDGEGNLIKGGTNNRVSSAKLIPDNPRPVIGIAVGQNKCAAILGACRGRLINGLITDEATARAVLDLA